MFTRTSVTLPWIQIEARSVPIPDSKSELLTLLALEAFGVDDDARDMVMGSAFVMDAVPRNMRFARVSISDIGLGAKTWSNIVLDECRLRQYGLRLCSPTAAALYLRLGYPLQPMGEDVRVGMRPLPYAKSGPRIFHLSAADGMRWLRSGTVERNKAPLQWENNAHIIFEMCEA